MQEFLKIFKSETFESYKSFVPVEVQSPSYIYNLEGKRTLGENTGGDNDNLEEESWLLKDGSFQ